MDKVPGCPGGAALCELWGSSRIRKDVRKKDTLVSFLLKKNLLERLDVKRTN